MAARRFVLSGAMKCLIEKRSKFEYAYRNINCPVHVEHAWRKCIEITVYRSW